jgi:hypothetical protein
LRDNGKDADILELPAGKYTLDIALKSTRKIRGEALQVIVKETVYIYPGLTTKAHYAFTEAHFAADVYLKGRASVDHHNRNPEDEPLTTYVPEEVQIKLYGYDPADEAAYIQTAPITPPDEDSDYYIWDLPVASEKINGAGNVTAVELRFVAASKTDSTQKLTSAWKTVSLDTIQGNTNITLSADVYPIVKETPNTYFTDIKGVSGIAHNRDAIAGTSVSLTITPSANYGVQGGSVSISGGGSVYVAPDGTFSFDMPSRPVTVSAGFFHLEGTATIAGNARGYAPKTIEAYGEKWDEKKEEYVWDLIGSATIAATGTWTIPIPNGYVSGDSYVYGRPYPSNQIQFKVTSTAANEPDQYSVTTEYLSDLAETNKAVLTVELFKVTGVETETTTNSVKILWEKAEWATGGYRIYRSTGGSPYAVLTTIAATASASYTDIGLTLGTVYDYYIVGLYGSPVAEGEREYFSALAGLPAPQNVTATKAPESYYPFKVSVSWDAVANADYYRVYRNESYITEVYSASYDDVSYKSLDQSYSYQVVAANYAYAVKSASSVASQVYFPTTNYLYPGSTSDYIGTVGEYDYYRFVDWGYSYYYFVLEEYGFDVYAYLYVNGSQYTGFDSTYSIGLSPGDEVVLAVRAYYYGDTGFYGIRVEY